MVEVPRELGGVPYGLRDVHACYGVEGVSDRRTGGVGGSDSVVLLLFAPRVLWCLRKLNDINTVFDLSKVLSQALSNTVYHREEKN